MGDADRIRMLIARTPEIESKVAATIHIPVHLLVVLVSQHGSVEVMLRDRVASKIVDVGVATFIKSTLAPPNRVWCVIRDDEGVSLVAVAYDGS